jgi:hypothetical protein
MKTAMFLFIGLALIAPASLQAELRGLWEFNDPNNLQSTVAGGLPLTLNSGGVHARVAGYDAADRAVKIGVGSYYICDHGIAPNGGGIYVNEFTLLFDVKYPTSSSGQWMCFYQTNPNNTNDGDFFVQSGTGKLGVAATGYTARSTKAETWYRVVVSVDNGSFYRIYVDGELWLQGNMQPVDGRFSLEPKVLLFADEDGEDAEIYVTNAAIWDNPLSDNEIFGLGKVGDPVGDPIGTTSVSEMSVFEKNPTPQTFKVQLTGTQAPTANVSVKVDLNTILGHAEDLRLQAPGQSQPAQAGQPITLTFTPADWQTPQTVGVVAVNDAEQEGKETAGIHFVVTSTDSQFNNGLISGVKVVIFDDESADLAITPDKLSVIEGGPAVQYSIVLTGKPTAPVTVTITEPADPNRLVINPVQLTFTPTNSATPQLVTVTAIDDQVLRGRTYTTTLDHQVTSTDYNYAIIPISTIVVEIQDNECGAWGFLPADLNRDCKIDLNDFAILAATWLQCTQPFMTGCVVAP